jgi:methyl-accepting chemotaxis protein
MFLKTIRAKLMASLGVLAFTAVAVGVFGVYKLSECNDRLEFTGKTLGGRLLEVGNAHADYLDMTRIQKNICLETNVSKLPSWVEKQNKSIARFHADLDAWEALASPDGKRMIQNIREKFSVWQAMNERIIALASSGKQDEASRLTLTSVTQAYTPTVEVLDTAVKQCISERESAIAESAASYKSSRNVLILCVLLGAGAAFIFSLVVVNRVTVSIQHLSGYFKDVAEGEGDLTKRIATDQQDELAETAYWFNAFMERLQSIIAQVASGTSQIASASEEISASLTQIADSALHQKDQTVRVATTMQEMNSTVLQVSENSAHAAESARHAGELARQGGQIVEQTVAVIRKLADSSRNTAVTVEELGKSSDQIGKIVGAINDIADQTNLLALNAAIEAARAGEQGRGFAVVADEVRKLAERTTTATKEIAGMIQAIQEETKKAVEAMHRSNVEVDAGVNSAQQAGAALAHIIESSESVQQVVTHIATAASEQSNAAEEINSSMDEIAKMVASSTDSAHQSAVASQGLTNLAAELQETVGQFKIGEQAGREAERRRTQTPAPYPPFDSSAEHHLLQ